MFKGWHEAQFCKYLSVRTRHATHTGSKLNGGNLTLIMRWREPYCHYHFDHDGARIHPEGNSIPPPPASTRAVQGREANDTPAARATAQHCCHVRQLPDRLAGQPRRAGRQTRVGRVQAHRLDQGGSPPSNHSSHQTRIPPTKATLDLVQAFIRQRSRQGTRTVAKDVMAMLMDGKRLVFNPDNMKDRSSCLRAVQRLLAKHGYKRKKRTGSIRMLA